MYCVKCGVELADSEKSCPLCGTVAYHPEVVREEGELPYPPHRPGKRRLKRRSWLFVLLIVAVTLMSQLVVANLAISGKVTWSYYASGGIALAYLVVGLPIWFRNPNPAIFVPTAFGAILAYVFGSAMLSGGDWFYPFALPIILGAALICSAVAALSHYIKNGSFFIAGGALIAFGLYAVMVEQLVYIHFLKTFYFWSVYPLIGCVVCGVGLILIGIVPTFREAFNKRFFI